MLPDFRYEATMASGVRENEICPVFTAVTGDEPKPDVSEVAATEWVPWELFRDGVLTGRRMVSIWCAEQVAQLALRDPLGR